MPRRGRSAPRMASPRPGPERARMSPPPRARATPPPTRAPAHAPQGQVGQPAAQGPGLMGQMAATAGGVAIGSVVGHGVSNALFGGGGSERSSDVTYQEPPPQQQNYQPQQQQNPCGYELEQFITCTQNQPDITLCQGFNEALKECKARMRYT